MRWDLLVDFFGKLDSACSYHLLSWLHQETGSKEILQWAHLGRLVCGPPPGHRFLCQPGRLRGQRWGLADLGKLGVTCSQNLQEYLPWATQEKWQPARAGSPPWRWITNSEAETECGQPGGMHHPLDGKVLPVKNWQTTLKSQHHLELPASQVRICWVLSSPPTPSLPRKEKCGLERVRREVSMKGRFPWEPSCVKGLGTSWGLGLGEVRLVVKVGNGLSHAADFFNYWIESSCKLKLLQVFFFFSVHKSDFPSFV